MLMNRAERLVVDSAARRALQRWYETPVLLRLGGPARRLRVLELGCGSGYGTHLIVTRFGAEHVDAVDLDPGLLDRARRRLARHGERVRLVHGDVTDLRAAVGAADESYDAVFDFGIVHHVEDWRTALTEVARVLRPGGRFYFDEVTARALATRTYRLLFDHPEHDRFTAAQFVAELERHGLSTSGRWVTRVRGHYVLGVATREAPH